MYGQQQAQPRQPSKPGNGRVWPARERRTQNSPHFTGTITLPDGHVMRVSLWESFANRGSGPFNGFSIKLSEDTRQGNGYQAQAGYGQPNGYGQQQPQYGNGTQGGYSPPQNGTGQPYNHGSGYSVPNQQNGPQQPYAPPSAYQGGSEGYVPGFDD